MVWMEILQAFGTITLPIIVTIILSNRQTHQIIKTTSGQTHKILLEIRRVQEDTTCLLKKTHCLLEKVRSSQERMIRLQEGMIKVQEDIRKVQQEMINVQQDMKKVQEDTTCLLKKIDFGFKANALMHGWRRVDGITPEEAKRLPEPKLYDENLGICYYMAGSG